MPALRFLRFLLFKNPLLPLRPSVEIASVSSVPSCSLSAVRYLRSTSTGQCANRTTRSATDPIKSRVIPVRPCDGITISSACFSYSSFPSFPFVQKSFAAFASFC
jgi:hypothetical protein